MPKTVKRPCKINPDDFVAIRDLVRSDSLRYVGGDLCVALVQLELVAAVLQGPAVDVNGRIDRDMVKNCNKRQQRLQDILWKSDDAADAMQYMCTCYLQPLGMVNKRHTPQTPRFTHPTGLRYWQLAAQARNDIERDAQGLPISLDIPFGYKISCTIACRFANSSKAAKSTKADEGDEPAEGDEPDDEGDEPFEGDEPDEGDESAEGDKPAEGDEPHQLIDGVPLMPCTSAVACEIDIRELFQPFILDGKEYFAMRFRA
eukprot:gene4685-4938_t